MIYWCPKYGIVWTTSSAPKRVKLVWGEGKNAGKVMNLPWKEMP